MFAAVFLPLLWNSSICRLPSVSAVSELPFVLSGISYMPALVCLDMHTPLFIMPDDNLEAYMRQLRDLLAYYRELWYDLLWLRTLRDLQARS